MVDASVAAKWFLNDERHIEEATRYLAGMLSDEITLHAPVLLKYEFGSILVKAQRDDGRPVGRNESLNAFETFHELPITYHEFDKQALLESLMLANGQDCSFQDSCYLWLARNLKCRLLTDDVKFIQRLPVEVVQDSIQLLREPT